MEYLNKNKSGSFILNAPCWLSTRGSQWEIIWTVDKLWLKCLLWLYSNEPVLIDCYAMLCYAILYYYIYYNILHYKVLLYYTTIILVLYHIFISACLCKTKFSYYLSLWGHFLSRTWFFPSAWKRHISRYQKFDLLSLQKCFACFVLSQILELVHPWTVYLKI